MTREQHLLVCLAEECSEVQKEVMKILRFGLIKKGEEPHLTLSGNKVPPNHESLKREIIDLLAVLDMLDKTLEFDKDNNSEVRFDAKQSKVEKYMEYAYKLGQLEQK